MELTFEQATGMIRENTILLGEQRGLKLGEK